MTNGYLNSVYQAAKEGDYTKMLSKLADYYQSKSGMKSKVLEEKLYDILILNMEHNIRRDILLGLGTDEKPCYNPFDLVSVHSRIERLLEIKSGLKIGGTLGTD